MRVGLPVQREIPIGSKWKEVDPRIERIIEVLEYTIDGKIFVKNIATGRRTAANPARFNGKRGGYMRIDQ